MKSWNKFEEKIQSLINEEKFISIGWKIQSINKVLTEGLINGEQSRIQLKKSNHPIYRIYSMTKPLISMLALMAIERNKLSLQDPIKNYLPYFGKTEVETSSLLREKLTRPITILDLLTHTSGLSYGFNNDCHIGTQYRNNRLIHRSNVSLKEFVEYVAEYPIAFQPGTKWQYSLATDVLAHILEIIHDAAIETILADLILKPLSMKDTAYFVPKEKLWRLMPIYGEPDLDRVTDSQSKVRQLNEINLECFYSSNKKKYQARGGHGLFSTTADYSTFCKVILEDVIKNSKKLISKNMLTFALKNQLPLSQIPIKINGEAREGYGWNLIGRVKTLKSKVSSNSKLREFGWAGAASTYFWIDPYLKITGTIMTQHLGHGYPIGEDLRDFFYRHAAKIIK